MAEIEQVTEDSLFDQTIDPPASEAPPPPAADPPATEQAAPPKPDANAAPDTPADKPKVDDDAPLVPSWRLKEITEERRQAQAERDVLRRERDQLAFEQQEFRRRLRADGKAG